MTSLACVHTGPALDLEKGLGVSCLPCDRLVVGHRLSFIPGLKS